MKLLRNTLLCALALLAGCLILVAAQGKQKVSTAPAALCMGHVTSRLLPIDRPRAGKG